MNAPTTSPALGARLARALVEYGPPFLASLLILPYVIAYGKAWPWQPSTIDLQVYVYAVNDMLAGKNIFETTTPFWELYFIYPPIAAVLMVPLAVGPYWMWQLIWTALLVWAQQSVLRRCGVPRGWKLGLLGVALVLCVEPIRTTLGYGQVNTMLMALVVADLLPDRPGEKRRIPRGSLIGLAAAIKLTPALFVIFCFMIGKKKVALGGIVSFLAFTAVGAIFLWPETVEFWGGLVVGDTRTASPLYVGNQSLLGVFARVLDTGTAATVLGLFVAGVVALLSTVVAAHWWQAGEKSFAVGLVGLATCLASPLSWTHHFVWVVPMGVAVLVGGRRLPRWARGLTRFWVVWISLGLVLAVLPYGGGLEREYTLFQSLVANLTPLLGVVLLVGLAARMVSHSRAGDKETVAGG
ncbi:MAG: glycosyltransferase 87 family protein [Propionibacteriaceae bacterium]